MNILRFLNSDVNTTLILQEKKLFSEGELAFKIKLIPLFFTRLCIFVGCMDKDRAIHCWGLLLQTDLVGFLHLYKLLRDYHLIRRGKVNVQAAWFHLNC